MMRSWEPKKDRAFLFVMMYRIAAKPKMRKKNNCPYFPDLHNEVQIVVDVLHLQQSDLPNVLLASLL